MPKNSPKFRFWKALYNVECDGYAFAQKHKQGALYRKHFYFWVFISVSLVGLVSAFMLAVLSALKSANLWIFATDAITDENLKNLVNNYVYISNTFNAIMAFASTLVSFFALKQGYLKSRLVYRRIDWELFQFDQNLGLYTFPDVNFNKRTLIVRVSQILDHQIPLSLQHLLTPNSLKEGN